MSHARDTFVIQLLTQFNVCLLERTPLKIADQLITSRLLGLRVSHSLLTVARRGLRQTRQDVLFGAFVVFIPLCILVDRNQQCKVK